MVVWIGFVIGYHFGVGEFALGLVCLYGCV